MFLSSGFLTVQPTHVGAYMLHTANVPFISLVNYIFFMSPASLLVLRLDHVRRLRRLQPSRGSSWSLTKV